MGDNGEDLPVDYENSEEEEDEDDDPARGSRRPAGVGDTEPTFDDDRASGHLASGAIAATASAATASAATASADGPPSARAGAGRNVSPSAAASAAAFLSASAASVGAFSRQDLPVGRECCSPC
eukprot:g7638.t1